jgi:valyl-tRNA synthetase
LEKHIVSLGRLARVVPLFEPPGVSAGGTVQIVVEDADLALHLEGVIDIEAEKTRLTKALEASTKEAKALEGRLGNPAFVERAKPEAVEKARADHSHHVAEVARLETALARLA